MNWALLLGGLALWSGAHFLRRAAPDLRVRMGQPGKGLIAGLVILSIVLMALGYRWTEFIPLWYPPAGLTHANNLLMVFAFYLFGVGSARGMLAARIRHPQLTAVAIWAIAHLLVNGDLSSAILFGGLLIWALAEIAVLNRTTTWERPTDVSLKGDAKALLIGLILMAVAIAVHLWFGLAIFGVSA